MIDHARRIAEEKIIDEMERRTRPLIIVVVIALVAILVDGLMDIYAFKKYSTEIETAKIFAQCLNKTPVQIDDDWAHCRIEKIELVKGIKN